jgi:mono/diheme cytochrome c family protein
MLGRAWTERKWRSASRACACLLLLSCSQGGESPTQPVSQPTTLSPGGDGAITSDVAAASDAGAVDGAATSAALDASSGEAGDAAPTPGPRDTRITYHKDIRALMQNSCRDCHTAGGIGPIPFDDWATVKSAASLIVQAVTTGNMPPFGWNHACRELNEDRSLDASQRALFEAWQSAGFPEGSASDYIPPAPHQQKTLGEPTLVMSMKEPHTPPAKADEYRCFVLDSFPDETYLTGMQILPGQIDQVHHVIIYRVEASALTQAKSLDQADPKPGYICNGGPGVTSQNMFSYRPGSEAVTFDAGDAAYMATGSLVIQVHYNTVFLANGKKPAADQTKIALWTLPRGQLPERVVYRTTTFGPINIPAGATDVVSNISRPMSSLASLGGSALFGGGTFIPGEIIGMTPHAHQLATVMNASLKRADGASTCLDDVKWDFQWQLDYMFKSGVPYAAEDTFVASCVFDNGPENQPVINGVKQAPKAVAFGERSTDEMCEHYIWLRFPRDAFLRARGAI